jgi:membrane-associated phospholipid phosphatase
MIATVRRAASAAVLEGAALRSLGVAGGALVVGSLALLSSRRLQRADVRAGDLLRHARSRPSDRMVAACTDLGSLYGVMGVAAALALTGHRRLARDVALVGSATWGLSQSAKTRVMRARPYEADGVIRLIRAPTGSSYPSTHAAVAAATMTVVATDGTLALRVVTSGLTTFVAASRVYVGVHYPSDVVGGVGIGLLLVSGWRTLRRMVPAAAVPPVAL